MNRFAMLIATCGGAGLVPKMPGTAGSLIAVPLAWFIMLAGGQPALAQATGLAVLIGWWAADYHARKIGEDDPSTIVIDELVGQWLTLMVAPLEISFYILGFILFRLFDIFKPWPVSWADRKIKGGFGIMLDDILAAIYAAAVLYGIRLIVNGS